MLKATASINRLGLCLAAVVALRNASGLRNAQETLTWIDQPEPSEPAPLAPVKLHAVIPVLREQQHVTQTLVWFEKQLAPFPGSTVTVVSTAREQQERDVLLTRLTGARESELTLNRFPQLTDTELAALQSEAARAAPNPLDRHDVARVLAATPMTADVIDAALSESRASVVEVRHVRYSGSGRKAAQVNAGVRALGVLGEHDYVAVYDVDSRPSEALLNQTMSFLTRHHGMYDEFPAVLQQSARFVTQGSAPGRFERLLCRSAARAQTLWTMRREVSNIRRYAAATRLTRSSPGLRGLAPTVGHGLLVRGDVFHLVGGLPTFTVLDDMPFGYRLTLAGIPVESLPYTTTVPAAEYVSELLAQGERWFQNYLDYPACARHWRDEAPDQAHVAALAIAAYRGMAYLLASPSIATCVVLAFAPRTPVLTRVTAVTALWVSTVAPVRQMARAEARPQSPVQTLVESTEALIGLLLKSIGPARAVRRWAWTGSRHSALSPKSNRRAPSAHFGARGETR